MSIIPIIVDIPFETFTIDQVADILEKSVVTIYNYNKRGKRITNDIYIKLPKSGSRIHKSDLILFIKKTNNITS